MKNLTLSMKLLNAEKKRVLVLDDDDMLCDMVNLILSENNFETFPFSNPHMALLQIKQINPAIIVSDITMSGMDGFAFRDYVIQDEELRKTPFIFLSGRRLPEHRIEGLRSGVDAYLTKPFSPRDLVETIDSIIQAYQNPSIIETDPLTKCFERSYLDHKMSLTLEILKREQASAFCAMISIEHFQTLNDTFEKKTRDKILSSVANIIHRNICKEDVLIRYAEGQFLLFMPHQDQARVSSAIERIRKIVEAEEFWDISGKNKIHVSLNFGISKIPPGTSMKKAIVEAEQSRYFAKQWSLNQGQELRFNN